MLIIIEQKKEMNIVYMASTREGPSAPVSPGPGIDTFFSKRAILDKRGVG